MKRLALLFWLFGIGLAQAQVPVSGTPTGTGYPAGATFILYNYSGGNAGGLNVVMPATPGKLNFVCGISLSGLGATSLTTITASVGALAGGNY